MKLWHTILYNEKIFCKTNKCQKCNLFRITINKGPLLSWEMKLGTNGGITKNSKILGSIQQMICWWTKTCGDERKPWKVSKLQRQGLVPMLISQAHLPTKRCSKLQQCVKLWTAESQVKQGVRRYKLWTRQLHPSTLCKSCDPWLKPVNRSK